MKKQTELLKLTQDLVFKSFFSRNKQVLLSLLRSFLPIGKAISDVTILNPEERDQLHIVDSNIPPDVQGGKLVVMDLRVKLISGENINVEMQTFPQSDFMKRVLVYWSRLYPQDLEKGEKYEKVHPAYSLIFATFPVLNMKNKKCVRYSSLRDDDPPHEQVTKVLRVVIVDLSEFKKEYTELLDLRDMWCYLLLHSSSLTTQAYEYLTRNKEMKMALEHLSKISKDKRLFHEALSREMWEHDQASRLGDAKKEGIAEGIETGRAEGMETVALRMLKDGYELSAISKITGLSEADIKRL